MVSSLNVTFNYVYMLNSDWPFGTLYCKISQFVAILSIAASVFTLMAISIDRSAIPSKYVVCGKIVKFTPKLSVNLNTL
uniref:CSON008294 protein n=1 Tax=Culicoides sonorensis TaxID=179676 RepID=A0A336LFG3_CULSO